MPQPESPSQDALAPAPSSDAGAEPDARACRLEFGISTAGARLVSEPAPPAQGALESSLHRLQFLNQRPIARRHRSAAHDGGLRLLKPVRGAQLAAELRSQAQQATRAYSPPAGRHSYCFVSTQGRPGPPAEADTMQASHSAGQGRYTRRIPWGRQT
jgi:hypothetical protein